MTKHTYQGPGRRVAFATEAMCSTSHPLAAKSALDVLARGGNAVDAAVAGAVVLTFCEPMMCGLGGDVFALVHEPGRPMLALNGSGRAPQALDAKLLRDQGLETIPLDSAHSVTVPGAVDAFDRLVRDHGNLPLSDVLAPAIAYAERGIPVCHRSAIDWDTFAGRLQGHGRDHFLRDGRAYAPGEIFRSSAQANALRLIASEGREAFYKGEIMEDMVATLREAGGLHAPADFASAEAGYAQPVSSDYRGTTLIEHPPNGQGATALLIANILARFELDRLDPNGSERVHLEAEAAKLAYAARDRFVGEAETTDAVLQTMLSEAMADQLASRIDLKRASKAGDKRSDALHMDTVYICVVDSRRMAVSLIYSTFWPFGSGLASKKFGISFQNRGAGFTLAPGHVNELKGGKRPLHTLIPGFMSKSDAFMMPFGVMGGPYQAAGHAHLLSNLVDYQMDLQEAIDAPRAFPDPITGKLSLEAGYSDAVCAALAEMGHDVERAPIGMGGAQGIQIDLVRDVLMGGSDPRKDGVALGI